MGGRLPDFLGLGVQKGGTTSLHCLLEQHPEVFLPPVKEVHFFSLNFAAGEAWYHSQFAGARPGQRCGEITPCTFPSTGGFSGAGAAAAGQVDRAVAGPGGTGVVSVFSFAPSGFEPLDLEAALDAEPQRLLNAEAVWRLQMVATGAIRSTVTSVAADMSNRFRSGWQLSRRTVAGVA